MNILFDIHGGKNGLVPRPQLRAGNTFSQKSLIAYQKVEEKNNLK